MAKLNWTALQSMPEATFAPKAWATLLLHVINYVDFKTTAGTTTPTPGLSDNYLWSKFDDGVNSFLAYFSEYGDRYEDLEFESPQAAGVPEGVRELLEKIRTKKPVTKTAAFTLMKKLFDLGVEADFIKPTYKNLPQKWKDGKIDEIIALAFEDSDTVAATKQKQSSAANVYAQFSADAAPAVLTDPDEIIAAEYPEIAYYLQDKSIFTTVTSALWNKFYGQHLVANATVKTFKTGSEVKLLKAYMTTLYEGDDGELVTLDEPITFIVIKVGDQYAVILDDHDDDEEPGAAQRVAQGRWIPLEAALSTTPIPPGALLPVASAPVPHADLIAPDPATPAAAPAILQPAKITPPPAEPEPPTYSLTTHAVLSNALNAQTQDTLKDTLKSMSGGSNPTKILENTTTGKQFMLKGAKDGNPLRFAVEAAAAAFYAKYIPLTVPVREFSYKGFQGALQPLITGSSVPMSGITEKDTQAILVQHAVDCFVGNGDAKLDNWLRTPSGHLFGIDQGQAFRFLLREEPDFPIDSFVKYTNAVGGEALGRLRLRAWANGGPALPTEALEAMHQTILELVSTPKKTLEDLCLPLFRKVLGEAKAAKVFDRLLVWQAGYLDAWTKEMKSLANKRGESFEWPADAATTSYEYDLAKVSSESMGMTPREVKDVQDAGKAGWRGKSVRVDKAAVEGQEAMIHAVKYQGADALLINWRLTFQAAAAAEAALAQYTFTQDSSYEGKLALPFDTHTVNTAQAITEAPRYYAAIARAIRHFNSNVFGKNGAPPQGAPRIPELEAVVKKIKPELQELLDIAQSGKTVNLSVSVNGTPYTVARSAIVAMVGQYLPYVQELESGILDWKTKGKEGEYYAKKKLVEVSPFLWEPPKKAENPSPKAAGFHVGKMKYSVQPNTSVVIGTKEIQLYEGGIKEVGAVPQYIVVGDGQKVVIHFTPATGSTRTHWGRCWAYIIGPVDASTVAKVFALFEKATQTPMKTPTRADQEFHFWMKQAYALLPGDVDPVSSKGYHVESPAMAEAQALYAAGKATQARDLLVVKCLDHVPIPPGMPETIREEWKKDTKGFLAMAAAGGWLQDDYDATHTTESGEEYESGRRRVRRIGVTSERLKSIFGADRCLAHTVGTDMATFISRVAPKNGALLAKAEFAFYGIPWTGDTSVGAAGSTQSDFSYGGATNVFACLRNLKEKYSGQIYLSLDLLMFADTYVVDPYSDGFGDFTRSRAVSLEAIHAATKGRSGNVTHASTSQVVLRHVVDLQEWLLQAVCANAGERQKCIALCKQYGLTSFHGGKIPEEVFVL